MNAEQWLGQLKKLDELINAKLAERQRLMDLATDISPKQSDGMPFTNTGTVSQKLQNAVCKLIMLDTEIDRIIDRYVDYKAEVVTVLESLCEKEYGVMHRYYVRHMTFEKIAEDMGYSRQQIWRIKKKALENLENVIECYIKK